MMICRNRVLRTRFVTAAAFMICSTLMLMAPTTAHAGALNVKCHWWGARCDLYVSKKISKRIYDDHRSKVNWGMPALGAMIGLTAGPKGALILGLAGKLAGAAIEDGLRAAARDGKCFRMRAMMVTLPPSIYWVGAQG